MMEQSVETIRPVPDLGAIQEKVVAKRFDDALTDLAAILEAEPENPDALYMAAVCCRYTHEFESALGHIAMRCWPMRAPADSIPPSLRAGGGNSRYLARKGW
jgi:hypothetical protein